MKNLNKLKIILFLTISVILTSCNNDSDNDKEIDVPATGSYITAKIDGASYTTVINGTSPTTASRIGSGSDSTILILGMNSAGNSISISLSGVIATGTYTINPSSDSVIEFFDTSSNTYFGTDSCAGSSGTITVTSLTSKQIEGTFSFSGKNDENCAATGKNVTNGSFRGVFQTKLEAY